MTALYHPHRSPPTAAHGKETPIRCLFINWKDDTPASQFSVPDDYTLQRRGLRHRWLPDKLEVFDTTAGAELYIRTRLIRSAYLIDIGPDQNIVQR